MEVVSNKEAGRSRIVLLTVQKKYLRRRFWITGLNGPFYCWQPAVFARIAKLCLQKTDGYPDKHLGKSQ